MTHFVENLLQSRIFAGRALPVPIELPLGSAHFDNSLVGVSGVLMVQTAERQQGVRAEYVAYLNSTNCSTTLTSHQLDLTGPNSNFRPIGLT